MTQVCVLERVVWSRRGPIISALMQQLEINKYRALGLSTFPYPQQSLGWFTKSNWLSVPAPGYIIVYSAVIQNDQRGLSFLMRELFLLARPTLRCHLSPASRLLLAPEMKRLGHTVQPVPHSLNETMFRPKQTSNLKHKTLL